MKSLIKQGCAMLLLSPAIGLAAEVHPDVTAAINYTLPELECEKPHLPGAGKDVVDPATGAVNREGVDSYTLGRYKRAEKRWMKCLTEYKEDLVEDFGELRDSASHGLTEAQAKAILGNMATIQAAVESPDGVPGSEEQ